MTTRTKKPTAIDAIMNEYIRFGCEVMTRREAVAMFRRDGVPERGIDFTVFSAPALTQEEIDAMQPIHYEPDFDFGRDCYERLQRGETLHVQTEVKHAFDIVPMNRTESYGLPAYHIVEHGKIKRRGLIMDKDEIVNWCACLREQVRIDRFTTHVGDMVEVSE